jgi:hypothetical protein
MRCVLKTRLLCNVPVLPATAIRPTEAARDAVLHDLHNDQLLASTDGPLRTCAG